jgi:hypothetical protein
VVQGFASSARERDGQGTILKFFFSDKGWNYFLAYSNSDFSNHGLLNMYNDM